MTMRLGLFLAILPVLIPPQAAADDWPAPVIREVFSSSRQWFVRVIPGESWGDTVGFEGAAKGPFSRAEIYRQQDDRSYRLEKEFSLGNPVAPVHFLVTDRGYLVTLDNWHNMGYGAVVASYSPAGEGISSLTLGDLFGEKEIEQFEHSVSSIWWRQDNASVRDGQQSVMVNLKEKGSQLIFEPETGAWQFCRWRGEQHLCRSDNSPEPDWKPFIEPSLRR